MELTHEARRQIVAGLIRHRRDVSLAAVRRAVQAAGHHVGDKTLRLDMAMLREELAQEEIRRRQELVATLLARKLTYREIQRALAGSGFVVSIATIDRDVAAVRRVWKERIAAPIEELRAQEVAEMDDMERAVAHELSAVDKGDHASKARYIAERVKIKVRKHAVLGLDKPTEVKHAGEIAIRFEEYGGASGDSESGEDDGADTDA